MGQSLSVLVWNVRDDVNRFYKVSSNDATLLCKT